jgi:hypothetical protein
LRDAFGAPLEHDDLHLCQSQLTGKPQSDWAAANYDDFEIIAHDRHSMFSWPSGKRRDEATVSKYSRIRAI